MHIEMRLDGDRAWPELAAGCKDGSVVLGELTGLALLTDGEVRKVTGEIVQVPVVVLRLEVGSHREPKTALVQLKVETLELLAGVVKGRLAYLAGLEQAGGVPS